MLTTTGEHNHNRRIVSRNLANGKVDPTKGIILVVQPSDSNNEFKPPTPVFGTLNVLQRLLARSSVHLIPVVVISPRLTESFHNHQQGNVGFDQSGFQQSSTYGGIEPPKGTTPWLLRDFIPPVYSYVGCAYRLSRQQSQPFTYLEEISSLSKVLNKNTNHDDVGYLTRVAITQSICQPGHPWHLFAVETTIAKSLVSPSSSTRYHYIASAQASAGRPTTSIIRDVLSEYKLINKI
jgi:hypothetical protein